MMYFMLETLFSIEQMKYYQERNWRKKLISLCVDQVCIELNLRQREPPAF